MAKRPAKSTTSNSAADTATIHDQKTPHRGVRVEPHQFTDDGHDVLTILLILTLFATDIPFPI